MAAAKAGKKVDLVLNFAESSERFGLDPSCTIKVLISTMNILLLECMLGCRCH